MLKKHQKKKMRHKRVRSKISGTKEVPRLCVFRSLNHVYAQLVDDNDSKTLASVSDIDLEKDGGKTSKKKINKTDRSFNVGGLIAQKAKENKIDRVVFDRGGYKYHGRVKSLANGAREAGLQF